MIAVPHILELGFSFVLRLRRNINFYFLSVLLGLCWSSVEVRGDGVVIYQATDLPDQVLGQDLWQYTYQLSGFTFQSGEGFSIYFNHLLYANLQDALPVSDPNWNVLVLQPDVVLQQPGLFDAQALVNLPSLNSLFSVKFIWLGTGSPAGQLFEQYNSNFQTISGGVSSVPEPQSLTLLGVGLLIWLSRRSWKASHSLSIS